MQEILDEINEEDEGVVSPYTITLGEFQAVYEKTDYLFTNLVRIMAELLPVTVRFSIGIGSNQQRASHWNGWFRIS